jgi:hypothetical protein
MPQRPYGLAEAERQLRVARRLYEATKPKLAWVKLGPAGRRHYIDQACQLPHADQQG